MAITKSQKVEMVNELTGIVENAKAITFTHFDSLNVEDTTTLRRALIEADSGYKVVKKTLLKRVINDADVSGDLPELAGNIAIAWSETDMTAPARIVHEFSQGHKDNMKIVGGVFEGKLMDAAEMNEIATIPSMHTLRGMFVNVINAPIQGFVSVLNQVAEKKA